MAKTGDTRVSVKLRGKGAGADRSGSAWGPTVAGWQDRAERLEKATPRGSKYCVPAAPAAGPNANGLEFTGRRLNRL
jgi:hypothetical protein